MQCEYFYNEQKYSKIFCLINLNKYNHIYFKLILLLCFIKIKCIFLILTEVDY